MQLQTIFLLICVTAIPVFAAMSEHLKRLVKVTEECRNEYDIDQDDVMEYHITKEITPELACAQACLFETMGMVAVTEEGRKIEVENWMILMPPTIVNHTKIRIGLTACNDIDSRLERCDFAVQIMLCTSRVL